MIAAAHHSLTVTHSIQVIVALPAIWYLLVYLDGSFIHAASAAAAETLDLKRITAKKLMTSITLKSFKASTANSPSPKVRNQDQNRTAISIRYHSIHIYHPSDSSMKAPKADCPTPAGFLIMNIYLHKYLTNLMVTICPDILLTSLILLSTLDLDLYIQG